MDPLSQNRRPDEEGIKTFVPSSLLSLNSVRTVDLMKKGLRHIFSTSFTKAPVRTVDLMKKGLRPAPTQ